MYYTFVWANICNNIMLLKSRMVPLGPIFGNNARVCVQESGEATRPSRGNIQIYAIWINYILPTFSLSRMLCAVHFICLCECVKTCVRSTIHIPSIVYNTILYSTGLHISDAPHWWCSAHSNRTHVWYVFFFALVFANVPYTYLFEIHFL